MADIDDLLAAVAAGPHAPDVGAPAVRRRSAPARPAAFRTFDDASSTARARRGLAA